MTFWRYLSNSEKGPKNSGLNGDSDSDVSDAGAVLHQLSYRAKSKLVVMWVEDWPVDDGCVSIHMMLMHEIHVSELRSETNF